MTEVIIISPLPFIQMAAAKAAYAVLAAMIAPLIDNAPRITLDELDELYPDE